MNALDMAREAARIVPPAGASVAIAVHDGTHHRAAFLLHQRIRSAPVGPTFVKPRDAIAFVNVLNGESPTSRPGQPDLAVPGGTPSRDAAGQPEAPRSPVVASVLTPSPELLPAAGVRTCAGCGGPLPEARRGQRRLTCSAACRQRVSTRAGGDMALARDAAKNANRRAERLGISGRLTTDDILALWARQPRCADCGVGRGVDHVQPLAAGGANDPANLQTLCRSCNARKGHSERAAAEARARHRERPDTSSRTGGLTPSRPPDVSTLGL